MKKLLFLISLTCTSQSFAADDFFYVLLNDCSLQSLDMSNGTKVKTKVAPAMTVICYLNEMDRPECKFIENVSKQQVVHEMVKTLTLANLTIMKTKEQSLDYKLVINTDKKVGQLVTYESSSTSDFELKNCTGKFYTNKDAKALEQKLNPPKAKTKIKVVPQESPIGD